MIIDISYNLTLNILSNKSNIVFIKIIEIYYFPFKDNHELVRIRTQQHSTLKKY